MFEEEGLASSPGLLSFEYPRGETAYLRIDTDGWAHFVNSSNSGTKFEELNHGGKTYYKVTSGDYKGYYLSYKPNGYVGVYNWNGSVGWKPYDGCLTVHGKSWDTYVYDQKYITIDDDVHSAYELVCIKFH